MESSLRANPSVVRQSFIAGGTEAAHRLLAGEQFDMIFVDLDLEGGPQLVSELRGNARYSALPFVGMSYNANEELVQQLLSSGLDVFMSKPLRRDVVRAEIEEIAGLRSGQSAMQSRPV
ncbi:MAG: response regulator [Paludibaculum sp.]